MHIGEAIPARDIRETTNVRTVRNQPHYANQAIEPIDYLRSTMSRDQYEGYCLGNVLKYLSRYRHKNGLEDILKANVYLGWLIDSMEGQRYGINNNK